LSTLDKRGGMQESQRFPQIPTALPFRTQPKTRKSTYPNLPLQHPQLLPHFRKRRHRFLQMLHFVRGRKLDATPRFALRHPRKKEFWTFFLDAPRSRQGIPLEGTFSD